ncbi:hypothetical protein LguiA_002059 [Lonicera macranthoides]
MRERETEVVILEREREIELGDIEREKTRRSIWSMMEAWILEREKWRWCNFLEKERNEFW